MSIRTILRYLLAFFCLLLFSVFDVVSQVAADQAVAQKDIDFFIKENTEWSRAYLNSAQKKYGIVYFKDGKLGEMWYDAKPGEQERVAWSSKNLDVEDFDFLVMSFMAENGSFFSLDVYWDTHHKKQFRPISYAKGDGQWHEVIIPVKGKEVRFTLSLGGGRGAEKTEGLRKVFLKPLKGIVESFKVDLVEMSELLIIPAPKEMKVAGDDVFLVKNGTPQFEICLNTAEKEVKKIITKELEEELGLAENSVLTSGDLDAFGNAATVITLCLGKESPIAIPEGKEAYAIKFDREDTQGRITLAANEKAGLYWAWQTLKQLLVRKDKNVLVLPRDIRDWPDYDHREITAYNAETVARNMSMKANVVGSANWRVKGAFRKPHSKKFLDYVEYLESMCRYVLPRGGDMNNSYMIFTKEDSIIISDDKEIDWLFGLYDITLKLGGRTLSLKIDDGGRIKQSFTQADKKAYNNDRLLSHAWFMKRMSEKIWSHYPDAAISGITKNYENTTGIEGYYDRIDVSSNLRMVWTGDRTVTFDYPKEVVTKYQKGIQGRKFIIFDNTPGQQHGMYRGLVICEKYAERKVGDGYKHLYGSNCIGIKAMSIPDNQVNTIMCLSIAEYMWNASTYDPEKARQRAIARVAGDPDAVLPILEYSHEYLKIAYKYPIDKRVPSKTRSDFVVQEGQRQVVGRRKLEDRELSHYPIDKANYDKLNEKIKSMETLLLTIEETSRNPRLTAEFHMFQKTMIEMIDYLHQKNTSLPLVNPGGMFTFDINNVPGGKSYKIRNGEKVSCIIYGQQTPNHTLRASFNMDTVPVKDVTLVIEGQDCDTVIAGIRIKINGEEIYVGKTPFVQHGWRAKELPVSANFFKKGTNTIEIINTTQSSDFVDGWAIISGISLNFD
ncbi:MAG: beta-N-acetylglucosaminidase domain-containing protein [Verrucomicrobiales bacterium]|nr:beta-N-acetylglucosaminidase domain-containing protein [Verrucomicrobiales bacterium]